MDTKNLHRDGAWRTPWLPVWQPDGQPHPRKRPRSLCFEALVALMMLMMLACTAVKDVSERWKDSGMDPALEGEWKMVKKEGAADKPEEGVTFNKHKGDWYACPGIDIEKALAVRTFARGNRRFMVLVEEKRAEAGFDNLPADQHGGFVWFYETEGDTLKLFMLKDELVAKAIADGRIKGTVPQKKEGAVVRSSPAVATLDDATCDALSKLAEEKDSWEKVAQYGRVKAESKPAEKK